MDQQTTDDHSDGIPIAALGLPDPPTDPINGLPLRMILVAELMRHPELTVAEMVAYLDHLGFPLLGRASKVISDALRWEVRRGRVARIGRGRYRYVTAPRSTVRRIRRFGARCTDWIIAFTAGRPCEPSSPDPRALPHRSPVDPAWPPWCNRGWLWVL